MEWHRLARLAVWGVAAIASVACGGVEKTPGNGGTGGAPATAKIPENHRAATLACAPPTSAPPTPVSPGASLPATPCQTSADCSAGVDGTCSPTRFGSMCIYDQCFADADCNSVGSFSVCQCKGSFFENDNCTNEGNCRLDADCGQRYCSPSFGGCGSYFGVVGFYCHTETDTCVDDADCTEPGAYCAFSPDVNHWACSTSVCAG